MKRLLIVWVLCMASMVQADPGIPDTVRIESTSGHSPGTAVIPVYFYNDERLSAVEIVLKFDIDYLTLDSFSLEGGRLDYIPVENIIFQDSAGMLDLWVPDWTSFIPEGSGLLGRIYFTMNEAFVNSSITIDTTTWPSEQPFLRTTLFSNEIAWNIYPQFVPGSIHAYARCGDVNCDNAVNILDIIFLIDYKFNEGPAPQYAANGDVNCDNLVNILDIIYLIDFKFSQGPGPSCFSD